MKKTLLLIAAGWMTAALMSGRLCAQDPKDQATLASAAPRALPAKTSNSSLANTANSTVSLRATKDFKGRFTNAKGEQWFPIETGFTASFTVDGLSQRAFYDKKGRWQSSMKDLSEKQLPRDVRDVVKRTYYDFVITLVRIIEIPGHMVYLVYMEDETSFKIVRVSEEYEMDVLEEFTKSR